MPFGADLIVGSASTGSVVGSLLCCVRRPASARPGGDGCARRGGAHWHRACWNLDASRGGACRFSPAYGRKKVEIGTTTIAQ